MDPIVIDKFSKDEMGEILFVFTLTKKLIGLLYRDKFVLIRLSIIKLNEK